MLSNAQIKHKEIYKCQQNIIHLNGEMKKVQNELLLAFNECAIAEVMKYNALKKSVVELKCKQAIKNYFKMYGKLYIEREHLSQLMTWKCDNE